MINFWNLILISFFPIEIYVAEILTVSAMNDQQHRWTLDLGHHFQKQQRVWVSHFE